MKILSLSIRKVYKLNQNKLNMESHETRIGYEYQPREEAEDKAEVDLARQELHPDIISAISGLCGGNISLFTRACALAERDCCNKQAADYLEQARQELHQPVETGRQY